jgi:predicted Rossmann-fold nucleotide-binding protein
MNIAVYCSSSNFIEENYLQTAHSLGEWIAKNGHTI